MKVLVVCQAFWPDDVATSLFLTDIGKAMSEHGDQVFVWASRFAYEDHQKVFLSQQEYFGVQIKRLWSTRIGAKDNFAGRIINFLTFELSILYYFFNLKRGEYDLILGLSTPPLVAFLCVLMSKLKKAPFVFWNMDLQPELSIQIGKLRPKSLLSNFFKAVSRYTCRHATRTLVLDQYMKEYLITQGISSESIGITQLWPVVGEHSDDYPREENPYRVENGFGEKIVIMYAGNQSIVHPLDTLLDLARELKDYPDFLFVFIGGGLRKKDVTGYKLKYSLENIVQLPFEPIEKAHISLAAADIQVVVMGNGLVGYTHPNKIYGAMYTGRPILYIGPTKSHVNDWLQKCSGNITVEHGQIQELKDKLLGMTSNPQEMAVIGKRNKAFAQSHFQPETLRKSMLAELRMVAATKKNRTSQQTTLRTIGAF